MVCLGCFSKKILKYLQTFKKQNNIITMSRMVCFQILTNWFLLLQARSPTEMNHSLDANRAQRELIAQLEAKNR